MATHRIEKLTGRPRVHGVYVNDLPENSVWHGMLNRCYNPKVPHYNRYGGRGIRVCKRWRTFWNFYKDMGKRPSSKHQIDRINNDGDYTPENCRWVTSAVNNQNASHTKLTWDKVRVMRLLRVVRKVSTYRLAEMFGVSQQQASRIILQQTWKKVA